MSNLAYDKVKLNVKVNRITKIKLRGEAIREYRKTGKPILMGYIIDKLVAQYL